MLPFSFVTTVSAPRGATEADLIGTKTSNGTEITQISDHELDRMTEHNISSDILKDVVINLDVHILEINQIQHVIKKETLEL